jgi:integrase
MPTFQPGFIDVSQILTRRELAEVVTYLKSRSDRLPQVQQNLALVRLACCCGLRASEIGGLRLADVVIGIARPYLRVRAETAKGGQARRVPLWWDAGTLDDIGAWKSTRRSHGANSNDPFLCSLQTATCGMPLNRHVLRCRFLTACRGLGWDRLRTLTLHHGWHTFVSHALAGQRTLAEVRAAV